MTAPATRISVGYLARRYPRRIGLSLALLILEGVGYLLIPLFIGQAVDDLLEDRLTGLTALIGLGAAILVVVVLRRLYDARTYAAIHRTVAAEMTAREQEAETDVSVIAARTGLLEELVAFYQLSVPPLVSGAIGISGTAFILAGMDLRLLVGCVALLLLAVGVYGLTARRNLRLNAGYNDELEAQVTALDEGPAATRAHLGRLVRWDMRLWDLDTANTAIVGVGSIAFLVASIVVLVRGTGDPGLVLTGIIYVLAYIEILATVPAYAQELIRLDEIAGRLVATPTAGEATPGDARPRPPVRG